MYLDISGFEPNDSPGDSRKKGEDEGIDETEELAQIASRLPRSKRLAVLPVPESEALLARHTSEVDNQTKEDQARERENLDEAEPELDLASVVHSHTSVSESDRLTSPNHLMPRQLTAMTWSQYRLNPSSTQSLSQRKSTHESNKDGDKDGAVDVPVPVPDDQTARDDLVRADDEVLAEVDEGRCEAKGGVDAARRVAREALLGRVSR